MERQRLETRENRPGAPSFEELATNQGVYPVKEFEAEALLGHPSDEDESVEEFSLMLRQWRHEGASPAQQR